mmetsp:Transcript_115787/g.328135  ORF Transcript_115787/g.328135 Transcript_115787/m.328135 type:complete len:380 (+) Transcript_115787:1042-2181(+)
MLPAADERRVGRVRRPAHHPEVPREQGPGAPRRLHHAQVGARHQPGVRGDVRHGDQVDRGLPRHGHGGVQEALRGQQGQARGHDGDVPVDARLLRGQHPRDLPGRPRQRRPGVHGRREHERPDRPDLARDHRGGRLPPEPAQDLQHPPRRRRPGPRADLRREAPGAVPAEPLRGLAEVRGEPGRGLRRPLRSGGHCRHPVDVLHDARGQGGDGRVEVRDPERQLHEDGLGAPLPDLRVEREQQVLARVHHRLLGHQEVERHSGGGHRQAAAGLRLPRAHDVLARRPLADGGADRVRGQGRAGQVLRCDDLDSRGDPEDRGRNVARRRQPAEERAPRASGDLRHRVDPPLHPRGSSIPGSLAEDPRQVLAHGGPRRQLPG